MRLTGRSEAEIKGSNHYAIALTVYLGYSKRRFAAERAGLRRAVRDLAEIGNHKKQK